MYYHGVLQTYFQVKLHLSKPYELYQITFCELGVLEDIETQIREVNPTLKIPTIEIKSKEVTSDNLTKVSEHLCVVLEKFLNFILRNKVTSQKIDIILLKLGLHESLWIFLNTDRQQS